ncbi:hypothetical protein AAG906_022730 [Vitis piasezkii]
MWITGTRGLNIGAVCGKISLIQSPAKMATPSRSRSSNKRLREENAVLRIQASSTGPPRRQRSRGQVANSRPEPESIYPETAGAIPETCNESSDSTHFSAKRQRDRKSQLSNSMRARLGPQEPGRPRPPVATTWAAHPDPMVTPMVQNVHPHRDPMVTPMMRNVHPHLAVRQVGRNLPSEPPIGSISKRLDDMLSTPFCSHIIHYEPPRGFLVPKFSTYDGSSDPFDHIMHYRQLITLDIGNDALLPSHGFIAYLPTLLTISGTCPKPSWDNTCARST